MYTCINKYFSNHSLVSNSKKSCICVHVLKISKGILKVASVNPIKCNQSLFWLSAHESSLRYQISLLYLLNMGWSPPGYQGIGFWHHKLWNKFVFGCLGGFSRQDSHHSHETFKSLFKKEGGVKTWYCLVSRLITFLPNLNIKSRQCLLVDSGLLYTMSRISIVGDILNLLYWVLVETVNINLSHVLGKNIGVLMTQFIMMKTNC